MAKKSQKTKKIRHDSKQQQQPSRAVAQKAGPVSAVAQVRRPGAMPPYTAAQRAAQASCDLRMTNQGRTSIVLSIRDNVVKYLQLLSEGVYLRRASLVNFNAEFVHSSKDLSSPASLRGTDVGSAARTYIRHMTYAGGSDEAFEELLKLAPATPHEKETIMAKKTTSQPTTSAVGKAKAGGSKPQVARKPRAASAAATFRTLIMEGKLTDDQIFAEVQKRHPDVSDDKRSYVKWYRNDLRKRGENPPGPKGGDEKKPAAKKPAAKKPAAKKPAAKKPAAKK